MATTGFQIRKATQEDAEKIRDFAAFTFRHTYGSGNTPENMEAYCLHAFSAEIFEQELADVAIQYHLAMQADTIVGFIKTLPSNTPAENAAENPLQLCRIYVHPAQKGQGIGAMLLATAVSVALENVHDFIWLGVWQKNEPAIAFYTKMGFEIIGTDTFLLGTDLQLDWIMGMPVLR